MKLNEFRAWLDGFTHSIKEAPTPQQWLQIKEKLDNINPDQVVEYLPYYTHPVNTWPKWYVSHYSTGTSDAASQYKSAITSDITDGTTTTSSVRLSGGQLSGTS